MSDVAVAPKPARNMKPMLQPQRPASLPQSATPPQTLREAQAHKLKSSSFKVSEFARARFDAMLPADWDYEDALNPSFWSYIASTLGKNHYTNGQDLTGAFIDLATEDHAFYAHLYVRKILKEGGLIVQCIGPSVDPHTGKAMPIDLATGGPWAGRKFAIVWNADKRGFDVVRKADGEVVADGAQFHTAELAIAWAVAAAKVN